MCGGGGIKERYIIIIYKRERERERLQVNLDTVQVLLLQLHPSLAYTVLWFVYMYSDSCPSTA